MWSRTFALHLSLCLLLLAVSSATKKPPAQPININSADSAQLQLVPGIGPSRAEKILQMRKSYGAFKSVNDLMAIRGIGPKRLEKMRKYLIVGKPAAPFPKTAQPASAKPEPRAPTKSAPTKSAPTKSVAAHTTKKTPPPQLSPAPAAEETEEP
jgi:competence ComEA-like helix-hairpin-helix protein